MTSTCPNCGCNLEKHTINEYDGETVCTCGRVCTKFIGKYKGKLYEFNPKKKEPSRVEMNDGSKYIVINGTLRKTEPKTHLRLTSKQRRETRKLVKKLPIELQ